MQQSSLLEGCLHLTGNLQSGSHGGGQAGLHIGFGAQGLPHEGPQEGCPQAGPQEGPHEGCPQEGRQVGCPQAGSHMGWHSGAHGCSGAQVGSQTWAGCSQTGAVSSQHVLLAQPTQISAVVHKKSNEAIIPSCFFINDSFRLFLVMVDLKNLYVVSRLNFSVVWRAARKNLLLMFTVQRELRKLSGV